MFLSSVVDISGFVPGIQVLVFSKEFMFVDHDAGAPSSAVFHHGGFKFLQNNGGLNSPGTSHKQFEIVCEYLFRVNDVAGVPADLLVKAFKLVQAE